VVVLCTVVYAAFASGKLGMIEVSNPASPVRLGGFDTSGYALGVAVAGNRIFVADSEKGLKMFCSLPNMQQMMSVVDGALGTQFTIEAASSLTEPVAWTPIFTTNPTALPFEFTDFDVRIAAHPQKFYRMRQP
jgi:LVIVD repeat